MSTVEGRIPRSFLLAALQFAATKDVRYYINGVLVEAYADRLFLVATDGAAMGVFRLSLPDQAEVSSPCRFVVPRNLVKAIKARSSDRFSRFRFDSETREVTLYDGDTKVAGKAVDGMFPEWRRVLVANPSGEVGQFNPVYLAALHKATRELSGVSPPAVHIHHNGNRAAAVEISGVPEFRGVLMPVGKPHFKGPTEGIGSWAAAPSPGNVRFAGLHAAEGAEA